MRMIGVDDNLGRAIQCQIAAGTTDSDKWKAVDWMEWQAKGVAPKILMPEKTVRPLVDRLLVEYSGNDQVSVASFERVIDVLAETYDASRQAAKVRLVELGYTKAEEHIHMLMANMSADIRSMPMPLKKIRHLRFRMRIS